MLHVKNHCSSSFRSIDLLKTIGLIFLLSFITTFLLLTPSTMAASHDPKGHKELKVVLRGNGEFTKNLYGILARSPGNVFFSPISIHAILSLVSQGAGDKTKEAFLHALNIPDAKVAAEGYAEIMNRLNNVENVSLLMANKVFLKNNYKLQKTFEDVVTKNFHSEVQLLEFSKNVESAKTINDWVEAKTNNKIKDLISSDDLNNDTRLVLVNAIYFKGNWLHPFEVEHTKTEKFYLSESETVDVQMMHLTKKFNYKTDNELNAQVLELPYSNRALRMIIILPKNRDGIKELEAKLANVDLTKITDNMRNIEVVLSLPKFKIEQTIDLKEPLSELGLKEIFDERANFSGMLQSPEPLCVSKVVQKAFIEVNEEGTEAAAATAIRFMYRMHLPSPPRERFLANHPFFFSLTVDQYGVSTVLFNGKISKPKR